MNDASEALRRLDRLEGWLLADAANPALLRDAFETALAAGAWARAEFHLRHALALGVDAETWALCEAHWLMAQRRWAEARDCLLGLHGALAESPAHASTLAHDLAYVDLCLGDHADGIDRLAPLLETSSGQDQPAGDALESLWLRLLHHAGELERAMTWLLRREAEGSLGAGAAGVGSLIALDQSDYAASLRWATLALAQAEPPAEALVARASLALAERQPDQARSLLASALARNGEDGRTWSAIGFAELLDQDLPAARSAFERATRLMPQHVGTWHGFGWAAIAQRDLPAARAAFDAAIALDRNFAESHGGSAVVHALAGELEAAKAAAARALGLDSACLSARYAEALVAGDVRDTQSLARLAERLLGGKRAPLGADMLELLRGGGKRR